VLRDRRAINERFSELQASVKREILVFTKPPYATPPQKNKEGLEVLRSHAARSIYELSIFDDPGTVEGVSRFIEAGEEARFVPTLPLKLVIIDEATVMFGMEDPVAGTSDLTIMVIEHPSLAQLLKVAFEGVWAQGLTFEEATELVEKRGLQQTRSRHAGASAGERVRSARTQPTRPSARRTRVPEAIGAVARGPEDAEAGAGPEHGARCPREADLVAEADGALHDADLDPE
jgi:hypothetical protein